MKKLLLATTGVISIALLLICTTGCLKDSCSNNYKISTPIYQSLTQLRAGIKSSAAQPLQNTGKIYVYGNYIFLNEVNRGIHVIDNSNPAAPRNFSFINIPGNVDIAVQGNFMYADCYSDIVVLDISSATNVQPVKFLNNALPENNSFWGTSTNPDSVQVIAGYHVRDTTVDCATSDRWKNNMGNLMMDAGGRPSIASAASASPVKSGQGGSMARFTIANNFMYGVTGSRLYAFNIANAAEPQKTNSINLGWGIETIYPFQNKLFIGSTTGMFIYDITNPSSPVAQGSFSHAKFCDPVIADGQYAYVTLRSSTDASLRCPGTNNELNVVDITNVFSPRLFKTYGMTNPHGLSKDGNTLFICDGKDGFKVFDATNPSNIFLTKTFSGMVAYDVITLGGIAIVVAQDGLYQYDYTNTGNIKLLSKITIENK